jgi:hypothetical protein
MTILNLKALAWALLAAPLVLLYLWRLRPRRDAVAMGFLWERVFGAAQRRSAWWPFRRPVSLCLQLALLALLCVALAEPHVGRPPRLVMVIDNSGSMNATDVKPTRLDQAKESAREFIAALGYRGQVAIVSAGDMVRVHCGLTSRSDRLEQALQGVTATDGLTRVAEAVALARRVLDGEPAGRIVVLSDGCFDGAEQLARQDDVRWILVGGPGDNVAMTGLEARRNLDDPQRCQVFAEVTSFASEPVTCRLQLQLNDKPVSPVQVELPAAGRWQRVFEMTAPEGVRLRAALDRPDALPHDDFASAVLPPATIHRVVLVSDGNVHLEKALEADPRVKLTVSEAVPEPPAEGTLLVLDGQVPSQLPQVPTVVLDPTGPCDLWELGDELGDTIVARQNDDLPLLAAVRLDGISSPGFRRLELTGDARSTAQPVAWTEEGTPVGYAIERLGGRVLVLSGLLEGSDFPLRPAFPVLVANGVDWVAGEGAFDHGGEERRAGAERLAGFPSLLGESDIRVRAGLASHVKSVARGSPGPPLWLFPAGAALFFVLAEWFLFQRRWTC